MNENVKNKESMFTIIATLLNRHQEAASNYRSLAGALDYQDLADWINSLARYHTEFAQELNEWANELPNVPGSPSKESQPNDEHDWNNIQQTITNDNLAKITDMIYESEKSISDYYKQALDAKGLPMDFWNVLEKQHEKILEILLTAKDRATVNY